MVIAGPQLARVGGMLRLSTLLVLATSASACMSPSEDVWIRGEYVVAGWDSPQVDIDDEVGGFGATVVDISVFEGDALLDHGTFHAPTANAPFELHVPRGTPDGRLVFIDHHLENPDDRVEYAIEGTVNEDLDVGTVPLP